MAYATPEDLLGHLGDDAAADLAGANDASGPDQRRIALALENASAELDGWLPRIPVALRPSPATLRVHTCKVATYLLTLGRPGKEFEQVRNAYTDTIAFYSSMVQTAAGSSGGAGAPVMGAAEAPPEVFGAPGAFKGFAP